jgi:glycosyltransferase involved in cell wall biosynthesis
MFKAGQHPRVLMISDVYFPRVNGVSTSIQTFRRDLAALGCESVLIAPEYPAPRTDEPGIRRVRSRYLPLDPEDRIMIRRAFDRVASEFAGKVDIVHLQTPFLAHYWGSRLARRWNANLVVSYHTYFEHYFHHYLPLVPGFLLRALARTVSRSQLNRVDCVIAPSRPMADALAAYGVEQSIEVLPTGLDPELFTGGDGMRFREAFCIDPDRPVLLTVGRVAFEKNLEFLIDVLERVRQRVPNVLLVIAGEGPALAPLKKRVARRGLLASVLFVGYLDRATGLLDCYRSADLFVFASRTETQGLVLLEAMALGTPVVSTAVMGTKAVLADAPGAIVVDETIEHFASTVTRLLEHSAERAALASRAARHTIENWSGLAMAERLLALYHWVAAETAPSGRVRTSPGYWEP